MTRRLLEEIKPETGLKSDASIGIKPNLVVAKSWCSGATTNPAICAAVIEHFQQHGFRNITIIESAWLGENTQRAFRACGYEELSERYDVVLADVKRDQFQICEYGGLKVEVSKKALDTDYMINLPLIKGHCQTALTCALKNMKGLISDKEKRRFHTLGLHKPIAYLNRMIMPQLTIADGTCTDPGFEEGGNPVQLNCMVAGTDSVLIDAFAAGLIGRSVKDIGYIGIAEKIGVGSADLKSADIVHLGSGEAQTVDGRFQALEQAKTRIDAQDACSACYANLLSAMMRLEQDAPCDDLRVCVGQGFKRQKGRIGSGSCTAGFEYCVKGCPPRADQIYDALTRLRRTQ
jgi:uncharacterized protein (DUF362 family)